MEAFPRDVQFAAAMTSEPNAIRIPAQRAALRGLALHQLLRTAGAVDLKETPSVVTEQASRRKDPKLFVVHREKGESAPPPVSVAAGAEGERIVAAIAAVTPRQNIRVRDARMGSFAAIIGS